MLLVFVQTLSKQSINMPQLGLGQMLATSAPSFTSLQSQGGDLSSSVDAPSLRGLAPNQMLVLINGKRRHTSALLTVTPTGSAGGGTSSNAVDMSFIPLESIDRIEILRDGASAQYGSDAIAGVINVILKKGTGKFSGNFTAGAFINNSPDVTAFGVSEENYKIISDAEEVDGRTYQLAINYGLTLENGGYLNITGQYKQTEATIRPNINNATPYGEAYLNNRRTDSEGNVIITNPELIVAQASGNKVLVAILKTDAGLSSARGLNARDFSHFAGSPATNLGVVSYNLELPLSKTSESKFYSFGDFGFKKSEMFSCFFRRPAQGDRSNFELYPNGYRPQITTTQTNIGFIAGVNGMLGDFKFDFSNIFGKNAMNFDQFNTMNASLQAESPTELHLGSHRFQQNTMNLDFSKSFNNVMSGFNLAFGTEFRIENYIIDRGQEETYIQGDDGLFTATQDNQFLIGPDGFPLQDRDSNPIVDASGNPLTLPFGGSSQYRVTNHAPNSQCFRGFSPENEANDIRTVTATYLDLELDVTDKWLVTGALRTENYSDFGGVFTGRFATRYSILDNLAIRGSYSTGFRAPSIQELNYSHTSTLFVDGVPFASTSFSNNSSATKAIGIGNLTEEKSRNLSLGITTKIFNKLQITVDVYKIDIDDRVFPTGNFTAISAPVLEPIIGQGKASFRINGGDITTKGLEIVLNYNDRIGKGTFGAMFSGIFRENIFNVTANLPNLNTILTGDDLRNIYNNRSVVGQFEEESPNIVCISSFTYVIDKWSINLRETYFGETTRRNDALGQLTDVRFPGAGTKGYSDQTFSGQFVTNLGVTYKFSDYLSLSVTGSNIFNKYPDVYREEERSFYLYGNPQQGSNGAYYSVRASFSL